MSLIKMEISYKKEIEVLQVTQTFLESNIEVD